MPCITVLLLDFKHEHEKLEINNTDNVITLLPQLTSELSEFCFTAAQKP